MYNRLWKGKIFPLCQQEEQDTPPGSDREIQNGGHDGNTPTLYSNSF